MTTAAIFAQSALLLTIIFDIALLFLLFTKRNTGAIFILFVLHLLGVLGWTTCVLLTLRTADPLALKLTFTFALFSATAKYFFVEIFPENTVKISYRHRITLILVGILSVITFYDGALFSSFVVISGYSAIVTNGAFSNIFALIISYLLIYPLFVLNHKRKFELNQTTRIQIGYLFAGFGVSFIIGLLTNEILPVYFNIYALNATGPIFSLVLIAFTLYIITRYRFLDIRIIIQRGIIYTTLLIITVGCYLLFVSLLGYLFQKTTSATILFSAGITMLFGIWGTPFIERYFRKHTDRFFFRDTYNFAEATRELVQIGNTNINLEKIVHESRSALARILKSEHVTFIFVSDAANAHHEKMKSLSKLYAETHHGVHQAALVFQHSTYSQPPHKKQSPMQENPEVRELGRVCQAELGFLVALENKLIGLLFVGKKQSGKPYQKMDLDLLENFSSQIAVAAEKALLYKQVAEYSLQLEERVSERTREIEKLRETEKQMMLDISHGLQTPLTILTGELEKLKRAAPDSSEFGSLEQSIDVASKFVYDLLRLARLERIKETQRETFNLSHLMEELVEYIEIVAHQRSISINAKIMDGCMMLGDAKELQEAFTNIMSNAIKYTKSDPTHKALIEISLTYNDSSASICITDNGEGIPEKDIPHLFERFYRSQHNQSKKGTGLGLAITKSIIERHGGNITVTSMIGKGTSFFITLPLVGSAK